MPSARGVCDSDATIMSARGTDLRASALGFERIVESDPAVHDVRTVGAGPAGSLPLTAEMLRDAPSGDVFGLTQNAGY